jgi:hypothetical protein
MPLKTMSEDDFQDACNEDQGFCTVCREFTRDCCEPDAECYACEECGEDTVFGAEQALIMGLIEIE